MIGIDISVLLDIGSLESIDRYEQYKNITKSYVPVHIFNAALIKYNFKPYCKDIIKVNKSRNDLIIEDFENGVSLAQLSEKYNISNVRAYQIVNKDTTKNRKDFGCKIIIKEASAKFKKWTLYRLSKELNLPNQSVYSWGNGKIEPSLSTLVKISKILGCKIDDLIEVED